MITRWELITKKDDMTLDAFKKYWAEKHAPLTEKLPGLRHNYQNLINDKEQRGVEFPRCTVDADGLEELWFENLHDMNEAYAAQGKDIAADYPNFAADVKTLVTVKNMVIPIENKPLLKRVSFIKRRADMDFEEYKHQWWDVHGDYVRQFKGVRGYCQSLILDRLINGKSVGYDKIPFDGIVELYFDDLSGLQADFASEVGKKAQGHGHTFLEEISTYLVEKHVVRA